MKQVYVLKNRYVDSVTLMGVAEKIAKLDGVVDELQPALREVPGLMDKLSVTVDEANAALDSVGGILGDVNSATHGVASVGESATRIVSTATSAAVGVVSKVASIGGITIPEGQQLIAGNDDDADEPSTEAAAAPEPAEEPASAHGGYVTYAPVTAEPEE